MGVFRELRHLRFPTLDDGLLWRLSARDKIKSSLRQQEKLAPFHTPDLRPCAWEARSATRS